MSNCPPLILQMLNPLENLETKPFIEPLLFPNWIDWILKWKVKKRYLGHFDKVGPFYIARNLTITKSKQ
jgi:hypothetical protein